MKLRSFCSSRVLPALGLVSALGFAACGDDDKDPTDGSDITDTDTDTTDTDTDTDTEEPNLEDDEAIEAAGFCIGSARYNWEAGVPSKLTAFPDDALMRELRGEELPTFTGLTFDFSTTPGWLAAQNDFSRKIYEQLSGLDGFGTSAAITLRFSQPLTPVEFTFMESLVNEEIQLWDLGTDAGSAGRIPFSVRMLHGGKTLLVQPLLPMRDNQAHALVITNKMKSADGTCITPSLDLVKVLTGDKSEDKFARFEQRVSRLKTKTGLAPTDISAVAIFTTQAIQEPTRLQAVQAKSKTYSWKQAPTCTEESDRLYCKGVMNGYDFRYEGYLRNVPEEPTAWELPVHIWLPKERNTAVRPILFGHGLGGGPTHGSSVVKLGIENDMATIAIAAPRHADHPSATGEANEELFGFFGINVSEMTIKGFTFRENLRQAAFDKLQVLELLAQNPDVDGDGTPDIDISRTLYWGLSLGGIMGSDLLALSNRVDGAILTVPGAQLLSIIEHSTQFSTITGVLEAMVGSKEDLSIIAAVAQTLLDAGDPVNRAPRVRTNRLDSGAAPHLLLQEVIDDGTVPNISTEALARALGVPQVPTVLMDIDGLNVAPAAPVQGNLGGRTGGLSQFDTFTLANGSTVKAEHNNTFSGTELMRQSDTFIKSWKAGVVAPSIINPYN